MAAAAPLSAKTRITKASISAITDEIGKTQADAIDFAHQYGLALVELRNLPETGREFAKMTEPELKRSAAELASNKLKVSFLNTSMMKFNWPGLNPDATVTPTNQKKWDSRKDDLANAILAANILGCDKVRVFTGSRVAHPETTYKPIVQTLEDFIPMAEKAKVHLLIENEYSQNIGNSAESRDILGMLPSKTIGLNWEPGNAQELKEIPFPDGYALVPKDRILNIHFKAADSSTAPIKCTGNPFSKPSQKDNYALQIGLETHGDAALRMEHAHASMDEMMHHAGRLN